jgi:hypothetical protein
MFKKLYGSMLAFRNEPYAWHPVCELTYDSCMIRKRQTAWSGLVSCTGALPAAWAIAPTQRRNAFNPQSST